MCIEKECIGPVYTWKSVWALVKVGHLVSAVEKGRIGRRCYKFMMTHGVR